jgi:hypothetical protein
LNRGSAGIFWFILLGNIAASYRQVRGEFVEYQHSRAVTHLSVYLRDSHLYVSLTGYDLICPFLLLVLPRILIRRVVAADN